MLSEVQMSECSAHRDPDKRSACPACGSHDHFPFYELDAIPSNSSILLTSRADALAFPRAGLKLHHCPRCGFVFNAVFDPRRIEYSERYRATQSASRVFNAFHYDLARRLGETYDLAERDVLEIGCGNGEFLQILAELGYRRLAGVDPMATDRDPSDVVNFTRGYFPRDVAGQRADFVICKMTLEHVPDVEGFVTRLRTFLDGNAAATVFFQVPNFGRILADVAFEDVYYEHCSYFTAQSLVALFERCGFRTLDIRTEYADQYLMLEAEAAPRRTPPIPAERSDLDDATDRVRRFREEAARKADRWRRRLCKAAEAGSRIVLWGSGSKASAFLAATGTHRFIDTIIDADPHKRGRYAAGSGCRIAAPDELATIGPGTVVVMNPIYADEIRATLRSAGLEPEILTL